MQYLSFDIKTPQDFFAKLLADYDEFKKDTISVRVALNCAMTAWHLIDWLVNEMNTSTSDPDLKQLKIDFKKKCPSLYIMQDLCNGTKHCQITKYNPKVQGTEKHIGDYNNDYSRDFDIARLIIELKDGTIKNFEDEIELVVTFWKNYLNEQN